MAISDKLNRLMQIKSDLKNVLLSKQVITESTPFLEYPNACSKLQAAPGPVTLTIEFKPKVTQTTSTDRYVVATHATNTVRQGYLKVNGVDYYDLVLGQIYLQKKVIYTISCSIEIPYGTEQVSIESVMIMGKTTTSPYFSRWYNSQSNVATATLYNLTQDTTVTFIEAGPTTYY
jgi:hypothetical protein